MVGKVVRRDALDAGGELASKLFCHASAQLGHEQLAAATLEQPLKVGPAFLDVVEDVGYLGLHVAAGA